MTAARAINAVQLAIKRRAAGLATGRSDRPVTLQAPADTAPAALTAPRATRAPTTIKELLPSVRARSAAMPMVSSDSPVRCHARQVRSLAKPRSSAGPWQRLRTGFDGCGLMGASPSGFFRPITALAG
jgi:hypothetical protein